MGKVTLKHQIMSKITIEHITRYTNTSGPHDPGYACAWALVDDRTFNYYCNVDGSRVRGVRMRQKNGKWVSVSYSKEKFWVGVIEPASIEAFKMEVS